SGGFGGALACGDDCDDNRGADDLDQVLRPVRAGGVLDTEEIGNQTTDEGADAAAEDGPAEADVLPAGKYQPGQPPEDDARDEAYDEHPDPVHGSSFEGWPTCVHLVPRDKPDQSRHRSYRHRALFLAHRNL